MVTVARLLLVVTVVRLRLVVTVARLLLMWNFMSSDVGLIY